MMVEGGAHVGAITTIGGFARQYGTPFDISQNLHSVHETGICSFSISIV